MSNSNGKIASPVDLIADVCKVLGVNSADLGYLCSNQHGKINRYSFIKTVDEPGYFGVQVGTPLMYVKHTRLKTYKIGDTIPTSAFAEYDPPIGGTNSPFRTKDFAGYSQFEYPHTVDLSSVSGKTFSPDDHCFSVPITYRHDNDKPLFSYLINGDRIIAEGIVPTDPNRLWGYAILVIAKYGNDTRYYIRKAGDWANTSLVFGGLTYNIEVLQDMLSVDITKYTCSLFAVAYLVNNPISNKAAAGAVLKPTDGYTVSLLPETSTIKPWALNIKFSKPKDRVFLRAMICDFSGFVGGEYVSAEGQIVSAYATGFTLNEEMLYPNPLRAPEYIEGTYGGWLLAEETLFLNEISTVSLHIKMDADGLEYYGNYTSQRLDGLDREFVWDINLSQYKNQKLDLILNVRYPNPDYRPD